MSQRFRIILLLLPWVLSGIGMVTATELKSWGGSAQDRKSVQGGVWLFVQHCQSCHGMASGDQERLKASGFSAVPGASPSIDAWEGLQPPLDRTSLVQTFGVSPPDLVAYIRARHSARQSGADWIYGFLHAYTPDPAAKTGWNNLLVPGTAMPNVLYGLPEAVGADPSGSAENGQFYRGGQEGFDKRVSDLVAYLVWISGLEHAQADASRLEESAVGGVVLLYLGLLLAVVYVLKREYWKDVR